MSYLPIILECPLKKSQKRIKSPTPSDLSDGTTKKSSNPSSLLSGVLIAKDFDPKSQSFISDSSEDSRFEEPFDSDILQIKSITEILQSGIKNQLKKRKTYSNSDFHQIEKFRKQKKNFEISAKNSKNLMNEILEENFKVGSLIKAIQEKVISEKNKENISESDSVGRKTQVEDTIQNLRREVEAIKLKLDRIDEFEYGEKIQVKELKHLDLAIDDKSVDSSCKCLVF